MRVGSSRPHVFPMESAVRIVLLGDANTGKMTLARNFAGKASSEAYQLTVGSECLCVRFLVDVEMRMVLIRDTAGQERFNSLVPVYCRSASAGVIVYSVTNKDSFASLPKWISFLHNASPDAAVLVFGNKIDLEADRTVGVDSPRHFCKEHVYLCWEGSARTGENVQPAFGSVIERCCRDVHPPGTITTATLAQAEHTDENPAGCGR
jgi:small GTP-binding protein